MSYKNLFFDLDDTLWAFSLNARDTYEEMYWKYEYNLSLIHISEPTRQAEISYAVFCLKKKKKKHSINIKK